MSQGTNLESPMMQPFRDIPVDGFTLFTSFTFASAPSVIRRWLSNDRINALRQSTMYNCRGYVARIIATGGLTSYTGQVRALPGSWLYGVSNQTGPSTRFWSSEGLSWTNGIGIVAPLGFQSFRNSMQASFIVLDEPWLLRDGIVNYETHVPPGSAPPILCFMVCEPRQEIKGEILSACLDKKAVEF